MLSSHLGQGLLSGLYSSGPSVKTVYGFPIFPIFPMHATCPIRLILYLTILYMFVEEYEL
jgi:hypothetical protein